VLLADNLTVFVNDFFYFILLLLVCVGSRENIFYNMYGFFQTFLLVLFFCWQLFPMDLVCFFDLVKMEFHIFSS